MEWILIYIIPVLLSADVFFLSISGGVTVRPFKYAFAFKIAAVFALSSFLAAIIALGFAWSINPLIENFSNLVGHVLLAFVGIKFLNDARKIKNVDRTYLLEDNKIILLSAVASSLMILIAYLGLGLISPNIWSSSGIILISAFILGFLGVFIGSHYQPLRLGRYSKFAAGLSILIMTIINFLIHL
jgi:putative Mn2+ efflux pump MntP